jgi:hypothetical protein
MHTRASSSHLCNNPSRPHTFTSSLFHLRNIPKDCGLNFSLLASSRYPTLQRVHDPTHGFLAFRVSPTDQIREGWLTTSDRYQRNSTSARRLAGSGFHEPFDDFTAGIGVRKYLDGRKGGDGFTSFDSAMRDSAYRPFARYRELHLSTYVGGAMESTLRRVLVHFERDRCE